LNQNQNKTSEVKIHSEQIFRDNNIESKDNMGNQEKKQSANTIAENISELKVNQEVENKDSKNTELNTEVKERNINTKSLVS